MEPDDLMRTQLSLLRSESGMNGSWRVAVTVQPWEQLLE